MEGWTRFVLRHRLAVLGAWLVVLLASLAAMASLPDLLTNRFTLPNTDTARAEDLLEQHFGQKSTGSFTLVVESEGRARELVAACGRGASGLG